MADQYEGPSPAQREVHEHPPVPRPPLPDGVRSTADPAVDRILDRLGELGAAPTADHALIYASLHDELLAELDSDPSRTTPGPGPAAARRDA